jgi:hypothetical protein
MQVEGEVWCLETGVEASKQASNPLELTRNHRIA